MRILFIPLDTFGMRSNEHNPQRIRVLSLRNEIVGVSRDAPFSNGTASVAASARFLCYAFRAFLYGLRHRKDLDLIFCHDVFYALVGTSISILTRKPCIRDCATVTREWCQRVQPPRLFALAALLSERVVAKFTRMMIVVSDADKRAYVEQGFAPDRIAVIPLLIDLALADEAAAEKEVLRRRLGLAAYKRILIFTGKRGYPPNKNAAQWINDDLAPAVSQRFDDVQILMTGSGEIPQPTHPAITVTGFVPDVFEYIHASDVFLAPIEIPTGVLTKVLDAMSCGRPAVVMTSAANGIPQLADGHNAMLAKDRSEFIDKTLYLLDHVDEAQEIGTRARKTIEEHYDWRIWEATMDEVLGACTEPAAATRR